MDVSSNSFYDPELDREYSEGIYGQSMRNIYASNGTAAPSTSQYQLQQQPPPGASSSSGGGRFLMSSDSRMGMSSYHQQQHFPPGYNNNNIMMNRSQSQQSFGATGGALPRTLSSQSMQYTMPSQPNNTSFYNGFPQQFVPYVEQPMGGSHGVPTAVVATPVSSTTGSHGRDSYHHSLPAVLNNPTTVSFQGVVTDCNNTGQDFTVQFQYDMIAQEILNVEILGYETTLGRITPYVVIIQPDYARTHFFCAKLPTGSMYFGIMTWLEHQKKFRYKVWFPIIHPSAFETTVSYTSIYGSNYSLLADGGNVGGAITPSSYHDIMVFFDRRSGQLVSCCHQSAQSRSVKPIAVASHPKELLYYFSLPIPSNESGESSNSNSLVPKHQKVIEFGVSCKQYQQTVRYEMISPLPNPIHFECDLVDPFNPGMPAIPVAIYYDRYRNGTPLEAKVVGITNGCFPQMIPKEQHSYNGNLYFFTLAPPYSHLQFHLIQKDLVFTVMPYNGVQSSECKRVIVD